MALRVTSCQGCIMVKGEAIDAIARKGIESTEIHARSLKNRAERDGEHFHLTVLSKAEVNSLKGTKSVDSLISKARKELKLRAETESASAGVAEPPLLSLGVGKGNASKSTAHFCVILWPELLKYRRSLKLSNAKFHPHITLGFHPQDVHGDSANKSMASVLPSTARALDGRRTLRILRRFSTKNDAQIILDALDLVLAAAADGKSARNLLCRALSFRMNLLGSKSRFAECLKDSLEILKMDPFHSPALISQAICLLSMKPSRPLEAAETFRFAQKTLDCYLSAKGAANEGVAAKQLLLFFGGDGTESERRGERALSLQSARARTTAQCAVWSERISKGLEKCRRDTLSVALNPRIRVSIQYAVRSADGAVPELMQWHRTVMPRNFSWIVDGWLCGVSIPKSAEQLKAFEAMNIGLVLSFFEDPIPAEQRRLVDGEKLHCLHIPTPNYKVPAMHDMERAMEAAERCIFRRNRAVLMHCGGGKGRAGTGLACFVVRWGLTFDEKWRTELNSRRLPQWEQPQKGAAEAIHHLKTVRPGSIETVEQEQFIKSYANTLWAAATATPSAADTATATATATADDDGEEKEADPTGLETYPLLTKQQQECLKSKRYPELIILCGTPGSGKTLFCKMLNTVNRQQHDHRSKSRIVTEWRFANQDELGKREDVELVARRWLNDRKSTKTGLVVDRCNVTSEDRKYWLDLTFKPKRAICIHFDVAPDLCSQRVLRRKHHPTVRGRSAAAVERLVRSFAKKMETPTNREGFAAIHTVTDTADLLSVCKVLGCCPEIVRHFVPTPFFKFPRTPHLWNTGAATRDDIKLDAALSAMYYGPDARTVTVTEKVDGANLGISLSANWEIECQHRGQRVVYTTSSEYSKLKGWLERKSKFLCEILEPENQILFGEWCAVKHSIFYDNLPDYFLVFDLYDRLKRQFMSRQKVEALCRGRFEMTRCIERRRFQSKEEIEALMNDTMSCYRLKTPGPVEGLYLKLEDEGEGVNVHRAKLVRSDFIQGMDGGHWIHQQTVHNSVRLRFHADGADDAEEAEEEEKGGAGDHEKGAAPQSVAQEVADGAMASHSDSEHTGNTKTASKSASKSGRRRLGQQRDAALYFAPMARSRGVAMSVKVLCRKLEVDPGRLLNVFVVGSRVWGTATSASDWDLIVVLDSKQGTKRKTVCAAKDNIDAIVWDRNEWAAELKAHRFLSLLTLFLPPSAVWKQLLRIDGVPGFSGISFRVFAEKLVAETDRDCRKMSKFFAKKKRDRAQRTFVHSLRTIEIGKRMIAVLRDSDAVRTGNGIDVHCNAFSKDAFLGTIRFDEIDAAVRRKQEELAGEEEQSADLWISTLKREAKECAKLL